MSSDVFVGVFGLALGGGGRGALTNPVPVALTCTCCYKQTTRKHRFVPRGNLVFWGEWRCRDCLSSYILIQFGRLENCYLYRKCMQPRGSKQLTSHGDPKDEFGSSGRGSGIICMWDIIRLLVNQVVNIIVQRDLPVMGTSSLFLAEYCRYIYFERHNLSKHTANNIKIAN